MSAAHNTETLPGQMPLDPLTLEGSSVLHQMMRFRWSAWRALSPEERNRIASEAVPALEEMERNEDGQSALFSMLGHKGDLMLVHYRPSFEDLNRAELKLAQLRISDYFEPATSFLSVVELGLYESSVKLFRTLTEKGVEPHSAEWNAEVDATLEFQRNAMRPRLYPKAPDTRYLCFYPMNRRRGERKNWYRLPMAERQRMMRDHGLIGRRYGDRVQQIITGSIGFDDWEWGVDLYADNPLVFKKLIYEMRFDEASADYADFGPFYVGVRVRAAQVPRLLAGELPGA